MARAHLNLLLARRFLLSKSSEGFLSLISWVSVLGVTLGVVALVVVTSVINGFEGELVRVITGMYGDVVLYSRGEPLSDPSSVEKKIRQYAPATEQVTPSFVFDLMVSGKQGVAGAILEGVDFPSVGLVTQLKDRVVAGRLPVEPGEVALGTSLAERIGARGEEDEVRLVVPYVGEGEEGNSGSPAASNSPKVIPVKVVGLIRMGMHEYDSKFVYASLPFVQEKLGFPGNVTSFKIRLRKGASSRQASDQLREGFGSPFQAKDWSQLNRNLFYAIQLEKAVISIILTVIVLVAAFNIVSTLMMMIHDKTKEIAILKAMGFSALTSFRLFVMMGLGIGVVGTAAGVGVGVGLNQILAKTHLIDLPADIYYIPFLPVVTRWPEVFVIALGAVAITGFATLYPSLQVSRRSPMEGIRHES
jgi:lipoprotein-releasing system permease protein